LQVSATPVREALLDLAKDGLIQMLPNRGFRVPTLSNEDLDQLFYLRILLEAPSVEKATPLITTQQRKALRSCVKETALAAKHDDLPAFVEWDGRFHLGLLEPLGNPRLVDIVSRLRDGLGLYRQSYVSGTSLLIVSAREHDKIMNAVEKGDGPAAGALMRHHLEHTFALYKEQRDLDQ
jgi:DNA-binding GntR family transcriptional regulator